MLWSDRKDAAAIPDKTCQHVAIWQPIPPRGSVARGMVTTIDDRDPKDDPACAKYRCVRRD